MLFKKLPEIYEIINKIDTYENIIMISPIWSGVIATPLITFINTYKKDIQNYAVITVCGGASGNNLRLEEYLIRKTGKKPKALTQLFINNLLPIEKKNKLKHTSSYRIDQNDIDVFEEGINEFIRACT